VLATGGALVECGVVGGPAAVPNVFVGNTSSENGGAISIHNAHLDVGAGERFESNTTDLGDGGAVFAGAVTLYRSQPSVGQVVNSGLASRGGSPLLSDPGARLRIEGAPDAPVQFVGNRATAGAVTDMGGGAMEVGGQGGAVFVAQQPALFFPSLSGGPPQPALNRTVGLLRSVSIRHIDSLDDGGDQVLEGLAGSVVALQGLDQGWIEELHVQDESERDAWIGETPSGGYDLGPYQLGQIAIVLDQGVGVLLIDSASVSVEALGAAQSEDDAPGPTWEPVSAITSQRPLRL
jgi:hypothetical protein